MMYCKRCGSKIKENDRFCQACGASVTFSIEEAAQKKEDKREMKKTEKILFIITFVSLALIFFPFHNIIVISGTVIGAISFLLAIFIRDQQNQSLIGALMWLAVTAVIIHASWFAYLNMML